MSNCMKERGHLISGHSYQSTTTVNSLNHGHRGLVEFGIQMRSLRFSFQHLNAAGFRSLIPFVPLPPRFSFLKLAHPPTVSPSATSWRP